MRKHESKKRWVLKLDDSKALAQIRCRLRDRRNRTVEVTSRAGNRFSSPISGLIQPSLN